MNISGSICVNGMQTTKQKHIAYIRNRDKKIKEWLKEYKSNLKCGICGENHPACLDFHHINPAEKKFAIGRIKDFPGWTLLKNEIAKCRVLCSNCHRKKHYEQRKKERELLLEII